jgi:hypothetical protein
MKVSFVSLREEFDKENIRESVKFIYSALRNWNVIQWTWVDCDKKQTKQTMHTWAFICCSCPK